MGARSRFYDGSYEVLGYYNPGDKHYPNAEHVGWQGYYVDTDDVIGNYPNANAFESTTVTNSFYVINYSYYSGFWGWIKWINCPVAYRNRSPFDPAGVFPITDSMKDDFAWEILARTNPSQPHVSLPTFYGELKDLPLLIKSWGDDLLEQVASGYLTWRWALKPMERDIKKMFQFVNAVDKRVHDLKILRDGDYLSKRCGLGGRDPYQSSWNPQYLWTTKLMVNSRWRNTATERLWGSAQWRLDESATLPASGADLRDLARRLTFGITGYEALATSWELMPWSWFVDWFTNVGDVISAAQNSVNCHATNICLMRESIGHREYESCEPNNRSDVLYGEHFERLVRKERFVVSPGMPFVPTSLPILTEGQWSILGSLMILKDKRAVKWAG
jgi:hypothetical protein